MQAAEDRPNAEVKHKDFAKRFSAACDDSGFVPENNKGRLVWLAHHLEKDFGITVSKETVRKWHRGEIIPRNEKLKALAAILKVDEAWLAFGMKPSASISAQASTLGTGAATVLAGFMQLAGANVAIPDEPDATGFYAILRGKMRRICACSTEFLGRGKVKVYVPSEYKGTTVVAVILTDITSVDVFRLPNELVEEHGHNRGPIVEVEIALSGSQWTLAGVNLPRVTDFARDLV